MSALILLLRHGQIEQVRPRRFVGQQDIPLDREGRCQAEAVRDGLANARIGRVVASDLSRALETAAIVCQGRGLDIEPEPALREIRLGAWEGLTVDEVRARFPGEHERRGQDMARHRPEGGESFQDLQDRVWPVFKRIAATSRETGVSPLIVAHAGVNRALLCAVLGLPLERLFHLDQSYCGLNRIRDDHGEFALECMNLHPGETLP